MLRPWQVRDAMIELLDPLIDPELPVLLLTPVWSDIIRVDTRREDLCTVEMLEEHGEKEWVAIVRIFVEGEELTWVPFPVRVGLLEQHLDGSMKTFSIRRLGPGTWLVTPSVNMPGIIHAFMVLCDVPEPPPWEAK